MKKMILLIAMCFSINAFCCDSSQNMKTAELRINSIAKKMGAQSYRFAGGSGNGESMVYTGFFQIPSLDEPSEFYSYIVTVKVSNMTCASIGEGYSMLGNEIPVR